MMRRMILTADDELLERDKALFLILNLVADVAQTPFCAFFEIIEVAINFQAASEDRSHKT